MRLRAELDPRRWSLATRLTLFVSVAMAALLVAVAWLMNEQLEHQLHEKDEIELGHVLATQQDIVRSMQSAPSDAWARVWMAHLQPESDMAIRILAPDGSVFSASPGMAVPIEAFAPVPGHRYKLWHPDGEEPRFILTSGPVETASGRRWVVQVAESLAERRQLLETFHDRLRVVVLVAASAALLAGWLLVRRGLRPLRAMSAEIDRVSIEQLHARIGERPWPSDVQALANNFDAMLGRLEAAFEQLTRFSSDLAHEFRSPITNLVAAASVTLRRERGIEEYKETLDVVVAEGERLSRMVTAMLFLARADNARQAIAIERVSVEAEFARLIETFEAVAEERGIAIAAQGGGSVVADPILLRRALANLLANAIAHTPAGGRITLSASQGPERTELIVSDTGTGIAPEHLPRIFDRFYRVDASRSASESTGLGLALVKSIAELHGGRVEVRSEVGAGSTFSLEFPARRP